MSFIFAQFSSERNKVIPEFSEKVHIDFGSNQEYSFFCEKNTITFITIFRKYTSHLSYSEKKKKMKILNSRESDL